MTPRCWWWRHRWYPWVSVLAYLEGADVTVRESFRGRLLYSECETCKAYRVRRIR